MPWYFLTHSGGRTHGYGVRVGPSAMCFWTADRAGISLWADVRCGGSPVDLGDRVRMTFRKLYTADGIHDYFWKATPVRSAAGAG